MKRTITTLFTVGFLQIGCAQTDFTDLRSKSQGVTKQSDLSLSTEPSTSGDAETQKSITELAIATPELSTLTSLVVEAGLADALNDPSQNLTVFAPTNEAFAKIEAVLGTLSLEQKKTILTYHVLASSIKSSDLRPKQAAKTLNDDFIFIEKPAQKIVINGSIGAKVATADIEAKNGVVHLVDTVLLPDAFLDSFQAIEKRFFLSTLAASLKATNLDGAVSNNELTVFAPSNKAFRKLPDGVLESLAADSDALTTVLLDHVSSGIQSTSRLDFDVQVNTLSGEFIKAEKKGRRFFVGNARIQSKDIYTKNGVIHIMADVITVDRSRADEIVENNIVEVASSAGIFNTLLAALDATDLTDALRGAKEYTVFAPTDEAFEGVDVPALLQDKEKLTAILLAHVVPGKYSFEEAERKTFLESLQGQKLLVWSYLDIDAVRSSNVIAKDIPAGNGIIHVIDRVIIPDLL